MLRKSPKLLFLAWPFPPNTSIAAVRTWNIARYLVGLGWKVTVVTPHPTVWRRVDNVEQTAARVDKIGIDRILTDHSWRCLNPNTLCCRNDGLAYVIGGLSRRVARRLSIDSGVGW